MDGLLRFSTVPDLSSLWRRRKWRGGFQFFKTGHVIDTCRSMPGLTAVAPARATASISRQPSAISYQPLVGNSDVAQSVLQNLSYISLFIQMSFSASSTVPRPDFPISPDYKEGTPTFLFHSHFPHSVRFHVHCHVS